jgi:hypothetical protein
MALAELFRALYGYAPDRDSLAKGCRSGAHQSLWRYLCRLRRERKVKRLGHRNWSQWALKSYTGPAPTNDLKRATRLQLGDQPIMYGRLTQSPPPPSSWWADQAASSRAEFDKAWRQRAAQKGWPT